MHQSVAPWRLVDKSRLKVAYRIRISRRPLGVILAGAAREYWMLLRRYRHYENEPHEKMMPVGRPTASTELLEVVKDSLGFTKGELIEFLKF